MFISSPLFHCRREILPSALILQPDARDGKKLWQRKIKRPRNRSTHDSRLGGGEPKVSRGRTKEGKKKLFNLIKSLGSPLATKRSSFKEPVKRGEGSCEAFSKKDTFSPLFCEKSQKRVESFSKAAQLNQRLRSQRTAKKDSVAKTDPTRQN